jgi:hypothetical protein
MFFSEEKKQKTFATAANRMAHLAPSVRGTNRKKSFASFLQKRRTS